MSKEKFGDFYFDPGHVVAMEIKPEGYGDEKVDSCWVFIRGVRPIELIGDAARKCFIAFMRRRTLSPTTGAKGEQ